MANTQAVCNSFKDQVMSGHHAFDTAVTRGGTSADTFKAALFLVSATRNKSDTVYNTTGEVSGTNYTAGGVTVTNATGVTNTNDVTHWTPSANFAWTTVTLGTAFDACLIYNSTQGDKAVAVYTFASQTVTAGNFTLTMPVDDDSTGLLRLN